MSYTAPLSDLGVRVFSVPDGDSAALRARWLAELSDALDHARQLLEEVESGDAAIAATELRARIEAARREVLALQLRTSGGGGQDFGPDWTDNIPWKRSA